MNVFVYGTLLVPRIWSAVTGLPDHPSEPARLRPYDIRRVKGVAYPGIVESSNPSALVPGRVFLGVPDIAVRRLDAYEDSFYERRQLTVDAELSGEILAEVYCIPTESATAILSNEPWTLDWFERSELDEFWKRCFGSKGRV